MISLLQIYAYAGGHENFFHHLDAEVLPREYNGKLASMEEIRSKFYFIFKYFKCDFILFRYVLQLDFR